MGLEQKVIQDIKEENELKLDIEKDRIEMLTQEIARIPELEEDNIELRLERDCARNANDTFRAELEDKDKIIMKLMEENAKLKNNTHIHDIYFPKKNQ